MNLAILSNNIWCLCIPVLPLQAQDIGVVFAEEIQVLKIILKY